MMVSLCSETRKTRTDKQKISLKALLDLSEDEYQFLIASLDPNIQIADI
jgi:hypothetical protein